jgi:transposase
MAGKTGQKKRVWSDDEKRIICEQTLTPGVSVAQVARRYSMNANPLPVRACLHAREGDLQVA